MHAVRRRAYFRLPLFYFVGVDNNPMSVLLAHGLLTRENAEAFEWVFSALQSATHCHAPQTIFTDQAISLAMETILPETKHRLCTWHIEKNMAQHLRPKLGEHLYQELDAAVSKLARNYYASQDEWEAEWQGLLLHYEADKDSGGLGFGEITYLRDLFKVRAKWSRTYQPVGTRDLDITTTQRGEGMNSNTKIFLSPKTTLDNVRELLEHEMCFKRQQRVATDAAMLSVPTRTCMRWPSHKWCRIPPNSRHKPLL